MLKIFDNEVPFASQQETYNFVLNSAYKLGWHDSNVENKFVPNVHSDWNINDLKNSGVYPYLKNVAKKLKLDIDKNFDKCIVNLSKSSDYNFSHCHTEENVLLYYVNLEWQDGFGGETIFYNDNLTDIKLASMYKPGRIVAFDGSIPHTIRPQSSYGPNYRFTISCFLKKEKV